MKRGNPSGRVDKVKGAVTPPDISEGFRRARSSLGAITSDLQQLRRQAESTVKRTPRPAKSK